MWTALRAHGHGRRVAIAAAIYAAATLVYLLCAPRATLHEHTAYNHFALLARAWLDGQLDLGAPPPGYAGNNDFALYHGRWYVVFPPFPAVLLTPLVAFAGDPTRVRDGQFFLWLAGIGPAVTFLALEKLRRTHRSTRTVATNVALALTLAFGTVYFFCAEQGTVWYAAHVVALGLSALYLLFALDAERPLLAGTALALAYLTRAPLIFAAPLFFFEASRVCGRHAGAHSGEESARAERVGIAEACSSLDGWRFVRLCARFTAPLAAAAALSLAHNAARFGDPFDFGYGFLQVAWQQRIREWGLFHYHYLGKNLGVVLTSLPWWTPENAPVPFQINVHGLALWVSSPIYFWLLWPRRTGPLHLALWVTVGLVAVPTLFYQNTGWAQFGYRFSCDYAVFLIALLAVGERRFGRAFIAAAVFGVVVNAFGALTFNRPRYAAFYFVDPSQRVLYAPD